jgi:hypothetical protein
MKAMILAAGKGTRVQPLKDDYTKITNVARLEDLLVSHGHRIKPDRTCFSHRQADLAWLIDDARHLQLLSEDHNLLVQLAKQTDMDAGPTP